MATQYETGELKYFKNKGGFGFVFRGDGKADVFIHLSKLVRSADTSMVPTMVPEEMGSKGRERYLFTGARIVLIEIGTSDKGPFAVRWSLPHLVDQSSQMFVVFRRVYNESTEEPVPHHDDGCVKGWLTTKTVSVVLTPIFVCGSEDALEKFMGMRSSKDFTVRKYRVTDGVAQEVQL